MREVLRNIGILLEQRKHPRYSLEQIVLAKDHVQKYPNSEMPLTSQMVAFLETPHAIEEEVLQNAHRDIAHAWARVTDPRLFEMNVLKEMAQLHALMYGCMIEYGKKSSEEIQRRNPKWACVLT